MERRRGTWRRREKVKGRERPGEAGRAARAEICHYWRKHGGFARYGIPHEVLLQVRKGWSGQGP